MKNTALPYQISEPPKRLQKARLDNIALVPASLLPLKGTYQPLANRYPKGSVLCVPHSAKHEKIFRNIASFFRSRGHQVVTLPLEKITRTIKKTPRAQTENLQLAF